MADSSGPRLIFDFEGFKYEVYDTQVLNRDYDTLLLAWRRPIGSEGRRSRVILKPVQVPSDSERSERAWEEVQLASHLDHPGIAKVYGYAFHGDNAYVVSEHLRGCYLLTAMDFALVVERRLSPAFAAYVAAEVAGALGYAHQRSSEGHPMHIVHRAVGPMRIRLGFDGRVKLTNFGSAYSELRDRLKTPPGLLRGDPAYCAPEVLRAAMESTGGRPDRLIGGAIDGKADVFSLGLVLLEMLLAEYPLDPTDAPVEGAPLGFSFPVRAERTTQLSLDVLAYRLLRFHPSDAERRLEFAPGPLRSIVRRALQPDPRERFSAAEMREELLVYLGTVEPPVLAEEIAAELKAIFEAAARVKRLTANPIERTALTPDEDEG
jgi:serine/threonine-protein kinase